MIDRISQEVRHRTEWMICSGFNSFSAFKDLFVELRNSDEGDVIILKISSEGGRLDIGQAIVQAIKQSKATVIMQVITPCYSMGALLALAGDALIMMPNTYLMFHTYSWGTQGKSDDVIQEVRNTDRVTLDFIETVCCPFLSNKEIMKIHDGKDLYINWDDGDLQKRCNRHFKGKSVIIKQSD